MKIKRAIHAIMIIALTSLILQAQPLWYFNLDKPNSILGYGSSSDKREAKAYAFEEISNSYNVRVYSHSELVSNHGGTTFRSNINIYGNNELIGTKVIKEEILDGVWYICVGYSTLNTVTKLSEKVVERDDAQGYLNTTPFGREMKELVGYNTEMKIFRLNNQWVLKANNATEVLTQNDLYSLYSNTGNELQVNQIKFNKMDVIKFKIESPKKYTSLLYVDNKGRVGLIESNMVSASEYPRKRDNFRLRADNVTSKTIQEMYISIFSDTKLDLSVFEDIDFNELDSSNFKFTQLIGLLNRNSFSSKVIKIRP